MSVTFYGLAGGYPRYERFLGRGAADIRKAFKVFNPQKEVEFMTQFSKVGNYN